MKAVAVVLCVAGGTLAALGPLTNVKQLTVGGLVLLVVGPAIGIVSSMRDAS